MGAGTNRRGITTELESRLEGDLQEQNSDTIQQTVRLSKRVEDLRRERYRWADMAMAGTVPADIAREKQAQLATQLDAAETSLAQVAEVQQDAMSTLSAALRLLERCQDAYPRHSEQGRRRMNQAFFTAIEVDTEEGQPGISPVRQPLFAALQDAARQVEADLSHTHEKAPEQRSGASGNSSYVTGSNYSVLVAPAGLEPATFSV